MTNELRKYDVVIEVPKTWEADFPNADEIAAQLRGMGLRVLFIEPDPDNDLNGEADMGG